ncbi:MAG: hypothetical protein ABUK01_13935 [Leptospirales bacterium]
MLEKFITNYRQTRDHWLFWPFIGLILLVAGYNFVLSDNGYFAYRKKLAIKTEIIEQINDLKQSKTELKKNLGQIQDEKKLIEQYIKKHYLYNKNVMIIKFLDTETEKTVDEKERVDLTLYQRVYIVVATLILIFSTLFFWKYSRRTDDA